MIMVVEHFKTGAKEQIYRRLASNGRMLPPGLRYIDSWVASDGSRCFQLMETSDPRLIDTWIGNWEDLVEFSWYEVLSSTEMQRITNSGKPT